MTGTKMLSADRNPNDYNQSRMMVPPVPSLRDKGGKPSFGKII